MFAFSTLLLHLRPYFFGRRIFCRYSAALQSLSVGCSAMLLGVLLIRQVQGQFKYSIRSANGGNSVLL
jgi:hypothetical protein